MSTSNGKSSASHGFTMPTQTPTPTPAETTFPLGQTKEGNTSIRRNDAADLNNKQSSSRQAAIPTNYNFDQKKKSKKMPLTGKVVESGQEHIGRWTKEEHDAFLEALEEYGKEWKKVAAKVKTRTVVQTRTHAQKYFQKLQKGLNDDHKDMGVVEMGTVLEAKKASVKKSEKSRMKPPAPKTKMFSNSTQQSLAQARHSANIATHAAAQLMAQMSQKHEPRQDTSMTDGTAANKAISNNFGQNNFTGSQQQREQPQSIPPYSTTGQTSFRTTQASMKIIPPPPEHTLKKGMFPKPSPAACGKRKMMELQAAQMLAGVASTVVLPKPHVPEKALKTETTTSPGIVQGSQEVPSTTYSEQGNKPNTTDTKSNEKPTGLKGLQIVNPENFSCLQPRMGNQMSPATPWDGQLEVLESVVKNKDGYESSPEESDAIDNKDQTDPDPLGDTITRSPLHQAVCDGLMHEVKAMIEMPVKENGIVNQADTCGFSPLHSAVSLKTVGTEFKALEMATLLLSADANVNMLDLNGNTALHWAARSGNSEVVELLIRKNCSIDLQNKMGDTALHWAMRAGDRGMVAVRVLLDNGARPSMYNHESKRPIDVAATGFASEIGGSNGIKRRTRLGTSSESDLVQEKKQSRGNMFFHSSQARTLILHHPECLEHAPKSESDWEAPDRINCITKAISPHNSEEESVVNHYEVQVSTDFDRASLELLSRVHSAEYLTFVNDLSKELERRRKAKVIENAANMMQSPSRTNAPSVVPFTPMVQRSMMKETSVKNGAHSDTSFSSGSLRAARRAAGAVKHAVDCVLVGRNRNAFCVVRPPGHHAGVNGLLEGGESCGFCIFNNVAAGAMHALSDESFRPNCERCAIVDIDAHHGNGTEEIVKKCHDPGRLFFFSVHIYDNDKRKTNGYKFYPGTGEQDDVAHNIINVPIVPFWREREVSQIVTLNSKSSVEVNTRNKKRQKGSQDSPTESMNEKTGQRSKSPVSQTPKTTPTHYLMGVGREAYRRAIEERLLPALRAFNPDLILLSLGLDASRGDVGNARHYSGGKETMGINLEPEDYSWTTSKILEVADICCQGRVVSVLEGGYGRTPSSEDNPVLDKRVFAECASKHIQALTDPYNVEMRY